MGDSTANLLHKLVFALDHAADGLLRTEVGVTYRKALYLVMIKECGATSQHMLAQALGHSDPAVSAMLATLSQDGYVVVSTDPTHRRKRVVTLSPLGEQILAKGSQYLEDRFRKLMKAANVNIRSYHQLTERIYNALAEQDGKEK